jgi:GNAT superfamily N-acetyltransferase
MTALEEYNGHDLKGQEGTISGLLERGGENGKYLLESLARNHKVVIAWAMIHFEKKNRSFYYVELLEVLPGARGHDIGATLLRKIDNQLQAMGFPRDVSKNQGYWQKWFINHGMCNYNGIWRNMENIGLTLGEGFEDLFDDVESLNKRREHARDEEYRRNVQWTKDLLQKKKQKEQEAKNEKREKQTDFRWAISNCTVERLVEDDDLYPFLGGGGEHKAEFVEKVLLKHINRSQYINHISQIWVMTARSPNKGDNHRREHKGTIYEYLENNGTDGERLVNSMKRNYRVILAWAIVYPTSFESFSDSVSDDYYSATLEVLPGVRSYEIRSDFVSKIEPSLDVFCSKFTSRGSILSLEST